MQQILLNHLKNLIGFRTKRKLVIISVDDYGNVRLDSKKARENMDKAGLKVHSRFDAYDTLETREDLEALYEVLTSVKDKNGNHAIFTPFAMPCNINFEAIEKDGFKRYIYELLPETYKKLEYQHPKAYQGAWAMWKEGIQNGIMVPQFHGREHFNLKAFEAKLKAQDFEVMTALKNRSYTSISGSGFPNISFTAAYEFEDISENEMFKSILQDGLDRFEEVYGYRSRHFNPPGGREHPNIHPFLKDKGVKYLDTPFIKHQHEGDGKYKKVLNWTGKVNSEGMIYLVRNAVFEPTHDRGVNWVEYSFNQIAAAFRMNKPAILSSHRVNFCGHIDRRNRKIGLSAFQRLLKKIVSKWPEVEFVSSIELCHEIEKSNSRQD